MVKKILIVMICAAIFDCTASVTFTSVETLALQKKITAKFKSLGGHQGDCMHLSITNKTKDTLNILVEAGRRLVAEDSTEQDILLVKNSSISLLPFETGNVDLFGFCCQSHDHSPKPESGFKIGTMANPTWVKLAEFIAISNFDIDAIQSAIWALSNNHPISAINQGSNNQNYSLLKEVADLKHEPLPWYNINYKCADRGVFSNEPERVKGEIEYYISHASTITIVVKDWNGMTMSTLLEEAPKDPGIQNYSMNVNVKGWKDGTYTLYALEDGTNIVLKKEFALNRKNITTY